MKRVSALAAGLYDSDWVHWDLNFGRNGIVSQCFDWRCWSWDLDLIGMSDVVVDLASMEAVVRFDSWKDRKRPETRGKETVYSEKRKDRWIGNVGHWRVKKRCYCFLPDHSSSSPSSSGLGESGCGWSLGVGCSFPVLVDVPPSPGGPGVSVG